MDVNVNVNVNNHVGPMSSHFALRGAIAVRVRTAVAVAPQRLCVAPAQAAAAVLVMRRGCACGGAVGAGWLHGNFLSVY